MCQELVEKMEDHLGLRIEHENEKNDAHTPSQSTRDSVSISDTEICLSEVGEDEEIN